MMGYFFNPFAGEIGRLFWWGAQFLIFVVATALIFGIANMNVDPNTPIQTRTGSETSSILCVALLCIYTNLCTSVNRLRDAGRSGWWYLAFNIPFIGTPLMLFMCGILPGSRPSFKSGYDPSSNFDADDMINRFKSGQSSASQYKPQVQSEQLSTSRPVSRPPSPQGFGKRRGFQGNWS